MENIRDSAEEGRNLVGIVPIAGHESFDFDQPWPDCMMPIAANYNLIEAAVVECAWAGCKSIWIVVNGDFAPIIKKRLGGWVGDPVWAHRTFDKNIGVSRRRIPIYYVGVNPKDRHKRDCTAWSVIHGAVTAFKTIARISEWMIPSKYYVSFPHGYFPPHLLREHRKAINSKKNCYISFNGQTIKNNNFMSFTFGKDEWLEFRRVIREGTGRKPTGSSWGEEVYLDPSEMWSARWFGLDKVFEPLNLETSHNIQVEDYFNLRSWDEYRSFLCASRSMTIKRPEKQILLGSRSNRVSVDYLDSDEGQT
jgi:hypothetical protein|tara:strand:- start:247 stop:1167 length:921 start_codon:yes stop_codon:yes gene_type:complete